MLIQFFCFKVHPKYDMSELPTFNLSITQQLDKPDNSLYRYDIFLILRDINGKKTSKMRKDIIKTFSSLNLVFKLLKI